MENYTINRTFGFVRFPFRLTSDNDDAFKEAEKQQMVDEKLAEDNAEIQDYEITTFRPQGRDVLTYDLFFNKYFGEDSDGNAARDILSTPYTDYFRQMLARFDPSGDDIIFPTFWNSLCYPYYNKRDTWYLDSAQTKLNPKRFDSKSYLYNSFLKMNFYTTPYAATQELLFQNVIYVNPRWCKDLEGDANGSWHRPKFTLDETTDGYYLYWLNNFNVDTFYVSFQFWDASNGKMINLIPTSDTTKYKQWVQTSEDIYAASGVTPKFDPRSIYMEYKLSYSNKTYSIGEFDNKTVQWNIYGTATKLYEIVFDQKYAAQNPFIYVENGTHNSIISPVITPDFQIGINTELCRITPNAPDDTLTITVETGYEPNFYRIRDILYNDTMINAPRLYNNTGTTASKVTITNNGTAPFYLKDIQIILLNETGSTNSNLEARMSDTRRDIDSVGSTYTFYTIPTPSIIFDKHNDLGQQVFGNLQYGFQGVYDITKISSGFTVADNGSYAGFNKDTSPNYFDSSRLMKWSYPITTLTFPSVAELFSEQLHIWHKGDDLTPINPTESVDIILYWGYGENYATTYLEPRFYDVCSQNYDIWPSPNYKIDLRYGVTLVFNDLRNTYPEIKNTASFTVPVTRKIEYKYKRTKPLIDDGIGSGHVNTGG